MKEKNKKVTRNPRKALQDNSLVQRIQAIEADNKCAKSVKFEDMSPEEKMEEFHRVRKHLKETNAIIQIVAQNLIDLIVDFQKQWNFKTPEEKEQVFLWLIKTGKVVIDVSPSWSEEKPLSEEERPPIAV